jgi:cyclopropane fatty-acyl-phospholipid synthase-like methyltransferase
MHNLPGHLGGHKNKTHLDKSNLEYMIKKYNVKTMLDIGCGPAGMVSLARELGIDAQGIDGDWQVERPDVPVTIHDYTTGPSALTDTVDLVWSCEFVEHVYEEYLPNFMKDFQKGKYVIMTFAPVGKKGHHHVNCNTEEYWIKTFNNYGFNFNKQETDFIRQNSSMGKSKKNKSIGEITWWKDFVRQNGLFFEKQ